MLYYNTETRKVLTSHNFHFLNLPEHQTSLKQLSLSTVLSEGEMRGEGSAKNDQDDPVRINNNNKCMREQDAPNREEPPRKLRAKA